MTCDFHDYQHIADSPVFFVQTKYWICMIAFFVLFFGRYLHNSFSLRAQNFRIMSNVFLCFVCLCTVPYAAIVSGLFIVDSNMTSLFRLVDKRPIYRWYNLIRTCADECDWLFHWQHKLCATFSASVNINCRLPIKVYYHICTLRHIRIEMKSFLNCPSVFSKVYLYPTTSYTCIKNSDT